MATKRKLKWFAFRVRSGELLGPRGSWVLGGNYAETSDEVLRQLMDDDPLWRDGPVVQIKIRPFRDAGASKRGPRFKGAKHIDQAGTRIEYGD